MAAWRSARAAGGRTLGAAGLWPIALAGFLARGGIVLLLLPIVVPPSVVGLATFIGPASITPDGPTIGLLVRITIGAGLLLAAVLGGTAIGAAAEIVLIRAVRPDPVVALDGTRPGEPVAARRPLLERVVAIRLVGLLPVLIALAIGAVPLGQITYLELTLPTDLASPIALRVAGRAPEVVGGIVLAWLFGEAWAGLAVRIAVIEGAGIGRALAEALATALRRLAPVVVLALLTVVAAVVALGAVLAILGWSWSLVRLSLLGTSGAVGIAAMALSVLQFAACWAAALTVAAAVATWRSLAWTMAMGEDHRGSGGDGPGRANL